ncbi:hypothetical protein M0R45_014258 [Rubus argutus]|uniref:Uncharacterized protein n=1 Tax=Rubus argutus TaxID=59490 RepID=A0AAW1XPF9_RUBAR
MIAELSRNDRSASSLDVVLKKKKDIPAPPTADIHAISQILPPPSSPKEYLYVQYGGQTYGFDVDFASVETVFTKLHSIAFVNQMYS